MERLPKIKPQPRPVLCCLLLVSIAAQGCYFSVDSSGLVQPLDAGAVDAPALDRWQPDLLTTDCCSSDPLVWLPELTTVSENGGSVEICVQRGAHIDQRETVHVSTKQLDLGNGAGVHPAAALDVDYLAVSESIVFTIGDQEACFDVSIVDNALREGSAELGLGIVSAEFNTIAPGQHWRNDSATGLPRLRIVEDDTAEPWPLELLQWDMTKAHPGVHYSWRFAVKGGVYPYRFDLLSHPDGMTIDPARGILSWDPPMTASTGNTVRARITDARGATLDHSYDIEVTTTGFFFVDAAATGGDVGPGTIGSPWETVAHASANAGSGFVYVRAGTYAVGGLDIEGGDAHRWLAYPQERPVFDLGGDSVAVTRSQSAVIGFELRNGGTRMFWVGGTPTGLIWRNNIMHGVSSTGMTPTAFVLFDDGDYRPVEGRVQYDRIVIQENTFYDLTNPNDGGTSVKCYNVKNLLFEDNEAYDIAGSGVSDLNDGYFNTLRNNLLHDCARGVLLGSQYSQAEIEVSHNLIYNVSNGIQVGMQPGYIHDVYIHHNVIDDSSIYFGAITDCSTCGNFEVYRNVITAGSGLVFQIYPVSTSGGYRYPAWVSNPTLVWFDDNLLWTTGPHVAGFGWGLSNLSWSQWRNNGFDGSSLLVDPELDANHALSASSPYRGLYGRD